MEERSVPAQEKSNEATAPRPCEADEEAREEQPKEQPSTREWVRRFIERHRQTFDELAK